MAGRRCLTIIVFLLLAGCGRVELLSGLKERDANEMMAIIQNNGIACVKTSGEEQTWILSVPQGDFSRAVELLKREGYPKDDFAGVGDTFKKTGFVSSPSEERIRFMHALAQDVSETISHIDGVLEARVHIVLPNNNPLSEHLTPSSAAVFIKHRGDADIQTLVPEIKSLVAHSIENLTYEKVTIALFPADPSLDRTSAPSSPPPVDALGIKLAPDSLTRFWTLFFVMVVIALAGLGAAGATTAVVFRKWKKTSPPDEAG